MINNGVQVDDVAEQDTPLAVLTWRELGVVGLGGALGVGLRYLLAQHFPSSLVGHGTLGFITPLLFINVIGAFLLGLLLPVFAQRRVHHLRLFVTTGILGGFTSYGALADLTRQQIVEHASTGRVLLDLIVVLGLGLISVSVGHFIGVRIQSRETA